MNNTQRNARNAELQSRGWTIDFKNQVLKHSGLFYPSELLNSNLSVKQLEQIRVECERTRHIPFKQIVLNQEGTTYYFLSSKSTANV